MHRIALVAAVAACLAACRTKPAQPPAEPNMPRFTGAVGQLDQGSAFLKFIDTHDRQTVALDLTIGHDDFEGGAESELSFFVIYDDCDNLPEGQKPNQSMCTGVEYDIPHAAGGARALVDDGKVWHLRGQFRVEHAAGQHQGLMSVKLAAISANSGETR